MSEFAFVGDTFTASRTALEEILNKVFERGSKVAMEQYKIEQLKDTVVSTKEAADYINCSVPTIIGYVNKGHRLAGKLKAINTGKHYKINKYDLYLFKTKMIA